MKKFNFRLTTVLELRKSREEAALRDLAVAQRTLQASLAARADFQEGLKNALFGRESLADRTCSPSEYAVLDAHIIGMKQQILRANGVIARAHKNVDKMMQNYLNTRKSTMAIEKLRERDLEDYRKEVRVREAREQDDLAVMRSRFTQKDSA